MTLLIITYIVCCILSYGMITASWYWHYEQGIRRCCTVYDYYTEHVLGYKYHEINTIFCTLLGPVGVLSSISVIRKEECPYWFKWSYKPLKKLQEDIINQSKNK